MKHRLMVPTLALCFISLVTFFTLIIPLICAFMVFALWADDDSERKP